jgi:HupE / UreJ protein
MGRLLTCGVAALVLLLASAASAHKPSDSYLGLTVGEGQVTGRWDIALRDLEYAIGLDRDDDGAITWGEVKGRHTDIAAYALARLEVVSDGAGCSTAPVEQLVDRHSDGAYAVLRFVADCPGSVSTLDVTYNLLFELDALHRGLVQVQSGDLTQTSIFSPERRSWRVVLGSAQPWQTFVTYLREGVWHIWIGIDHILFLISLLLPAVLRRSDGRWQAVERFDQAFLGTVKVVTAFTLAHSITLTLAALGVIQLPSRLVESAIAASVVIAALNNLHPLITRRLWLVAFGFGLIHGFGFASVLADLGVPKNALLLALFSFNFGVELGQLAIVVLIMPLTFALRRTWLYPWVIVRVGSLLIVAVAAAWLLQRGFGLALAG